MGRLIYSFNVSLDGYIETVDKSLDWGLIYEEVHTYFNEQTRAARRVALRPAPVGAHERLLADRRGRPRRDAVHGRLRPRLDGHAEVRVLLDAGPRGPWRPSRPRRCRRCVGQVRREFDGDLEVGGANLAAQFIERGLVDEYRLMVHPVAIGGGTPFWPAGKRLSVRETDSRTFANGCRLLTYVPA